MSASTFFSLLMFAAVALSSGCGESVVTDTIVQPVELPTIQEAYDSVGLSMLAPYDRGDDPPHYFYMLDGFVAHPTQEQMRLYESAQFQHYSGRESYPTPSVPTTYPVPAGYCRWYHDGGSECMECPDCCNDVFTCELCTVEDYNYRGGVFCRPCPGSCPNGNGPPGCSDGEPFPGTGLCDAEWLTGEWCGYTCDVQAAGRCCGDCGCDLFMCKQKCDEEQQCPGVDHPDTWLNDHWAP